MPAPRFPGDVPLPPAIDTEADEPYVNVYKEMPLESQLTQICQAVAGQLSKALFRDIRRIVEDHDRLLAKQQLVLKDIQQWERRLPLVRPEQRTFKEAVLSPPVKEPTDPLENGVDITLWAGDSEQVDNNDRESIGGPYTPKHFEECYATSSVNSGLQFKEESTIATPVPQRLTTVSKAFQIIDSSVAPFTVSTTARDMYGRGDQSIRSIRSTRNKSTKQSVALRDMDLTPSVKSSCTSDDGRAKMHDKSRSRTLNLGKEKNLFGDLGMDKSNLDQEEYNVAMYYHKSGWSQMVAKSEIFQNFTLLVIFINAIYIGVDANYNEEDNLADADIQYVVMENLFCTFFTLELIVRFAAFANKKDCLKDRWFKFDSLLVALMIVETWMLPVVLKGAKIPIPTGLMKLFRLLRLARMARVMRSFPDLVAMIKGVKVASRAVGSALLMLASLVYIFSIIMFTLVEGTKDDLVAKRFTPLGTTMWTLMIDGTFLDNIGYVSRMLLDSEAYDACAVLMLFVLFSSLTVMNMLIGVLCTVVSQVADAEKEDSAIRIVKGRLLHMLKDLDEDGSGEISKDEIQQVFKNQECLAVLGGLHVDVGNFMDQLDMLFEESESGDLTIHQIMELILTLRGERPPLMSDILHSQNFNRWKLMQIITQHSSEVQETFEQLSRETLHRSRA